MSKWSDYADLDYGAKIRRYEQQKEAFLRAHNLVKSHQQAGEPAGWEAVPALFSVWAPGVSKAFVRLGTGQYAEVTCYEYEHDEGMDYQYHTTYFK